MIGSLKDLMSNLTNMCRNHHKEAKGEANHDVAIPIPVNETPETRSKNIQARAGESRPNLLPLIKKQINKSYRKISVC